MNRIKMTRILNSELMNSSGMRYLAMLLIPLCLIIITHVICNSIGCNEWYSLSGLHMHCNACIDLKKILKDNQLTMYCSIGSYLFTKINTYIDDTCNAIHKGKKEL